ncbi:MAG TPA: flagellin [Thiobacillus sp.]|nr:flagellin [Thiobacillus sp.]
MAAVINTNIASLNTQRNLGMSQSALNTSIQRLSSGLRVNSAKDDAAGMAIGERMTSQIRGLNQAVRNANDGISLAQTAEGALSTVTENLQRIRELAVQSRNATNSASDRAALNTEAQQLKAEIDRVATTTSFNGVKLLDGNFSNQAFQVGANVGETISIASIANAQSAALGTSSIAQVTGAAASAFTAITAGDLTINGVSIGGIAADTNAANRASSIANAVNSFSSQTGVYATILSSAPTQLVLTNSGSVPATPSIVIAHAGASSTALTTGLTAGTTAAATATGFAALDISSTGGADTAITAMDAALTAVNTARSTLGAYQNRFSSVVANLQTTSENVSAARSRILDADFAAETANLTRGQILQQAGTAMLAQANSLPNNVLSLLRG